MDLNEVQYNQKYNIGRYYSDTNNNTGTIRSAVSMSYDNEMKLK